MKGQGPSIGWIATAALLACACSAPPWQIGATLTGEPSIPPASERPGPTEARAIAADERRAGHPSLELAALLALDDAWRSNGVERARLGAAENGRLVELLVARAAVFHRLGRAVPESRDLELANEIDPSAGGALRARRAKAAVAAGDFWKAIGARDDAVRAFGLAASLGGVAPPSETEAPRPAAGPIDAASPVAPSPGPPAAGGDAVAAASPVASVVSSASAPPDRADAEKATGGSAPPRVVGPTLVRPAPAALPADVENWVLGEPAISARVLSLAKDLPAVLEDLPRALHWVSLMLDEDPSSPDVLELAAFVFGRARRFGGTERMLMELAFHTPDRAAGLARGAAVWERLGRPREACAQWIRAARWRDDPEDPLWPRAVTCARRDPGAGDWRAIRAYVLDRARPDRRRAIAAGLDEATP